MGKKGKRNKKAKAKVADDSHVGQPKCLKQILWERGWIPKEKENMSNVEALDMLMIMSDGPHILAHLAALVPGDFGGVTEDELSSRWSEVSRRIKHRGMLGKLTNEERINIAVQVRQERELLLSVARGGLDDSTDVEKMPSLRSKQQESTKYQKSTLVTEDEGEVAVSENKTTKKKKKKKKKTMTSTDTTPTLTPTIVSDQEWIAARIALLEDEKALSKATMALAKKRAALPWRVIQDYELEYVVE
jgi:hypothetical protein